MDRRFHFATDDKLEKPSKKKAKVTADQYENEKSINKSNSLSVNNSSTVDFASSDDENEVATTLNKANLNQEMNDIKSNEFGIKSDAPHRASNIDDLILPTAGTKRSLSPLLTSENEFEFEDSIDLQQSEKYLHHKSTRRIVNDPEDSD